jgi:hypothetical protein|tara:strand:- start:305 stop:955 length:651 start_codon:yes stop_codon:yes gene_type:complete
MVPITIIDNFFDNPDQVRNIALSSDYERQDDSTFPGYRTKMIAEIDKTIYRTVMEKVLGLFWDLTRDELEVKFKTHFQFIPRQYGNGGWAHFDKSTTFAGVVYMTPDAPKDCGTSICRPVTDTPIYNFDIRNNFYQGKDTNYNDYCAAKDSHNSQFDHTLSVDNVFNRMVLYDGNDGHRENGYFGTTLYDSRMTVVFFVELKLGPNVKFPVNRMFV